VASHDENVCATAFVSTVATSAWIGFGATEGVVTVGAAVPESWVAAIVSVWVSVSGVVAPIRDTAEPSAAEASLPDVCVRVDDFGRGAGSDDTAVSDRLVPLRDPLWEAEVPGAGEASGTSACPVVPSPAPSAGSSSVIGSLSGVDEWAPPECDTVTPGPTSTVVDEPASVSEVVDLDGPGDESSDLPDGAAGAPWAAVESTCLSAEVAASLAPSEAPGLEADGESLVVSGAAHAIPAGAAMADPMPSATARAPTRPT
jgi:hypothetical protein